MSINTLFWLNTFKRPT